MRAKIQKWGNSLAVRIPKAVTDKVGLKAEDQLEIDVRNEKVILLPRKEREYTLKELMKGVTKKNLHKEIDFGAPVGREML